MQKQSATKAQASQPALETLADALARHKSHRPGRQMTDITAAIYSAATPRCYGLLEKHFYKDQKDMGVITEYMTEEADAEGRYMTLLLVCGVFIMGHRRVRVLDAVVRSIERAETQEDKALLLRMNRALRLLKHLVEIGCLQRGEVAGIKNGVTCHPSSRT